MRIRLSIAVLGLTVAGIMPAMAQNNGQTGQTYNNARIYNTQQGYNQNQINVPVYNSGSNAQPLPMQQMIAGQNAPSYNFNSNAYNYGGANQPMSGSAMTPEQARAIRAQRDAEAQAYEAQYMQQLQQQFQNKGTGNASSYQGSAFSNLYNQDEEKKVPTKRRVVYNERNNPLTTPPRLFNPDQ